MSLHNYPPALANLASPVYLHVVCEFGPINKVNGSHTRSKMSMGGGD